MTFDGNWMCIADKWRPMIVCSGEILPHIQMSLLNHRKYDWGWMVDVGGLLKIYRCGQPTIHLPTWWTTNIYKYIGYRVLQYQMLQCTYIHIIDYVKRNRKNTQMRYIKVGMEVGYSLHEEKITNYPQIDFAATSII